MNEEYDGQPLETMTKDELLDFLMQGMNYIAVEGRRPEARAPWLSEVATDIMHSISRAGWVVEEEEPSLWEAERPKRKH